MLSCFDFMREFSLLSVGLRLLLAVFCGGVIGIEREFKRRPAGFRTHILLCLGASITMLTSQYVYLVLHLYTDVARLGAQVVAGIGFIGAGSIIVTNNKRIRGLTTAAGMWTAAIIGLACGAGYVECAVAATAAVILAEIVFMRLEGLFTKRTADVNLYVEYEEADCLQDILRAAKLRRIKIGSLEITRIPCEGGKNSYCAMLAFQTDREKLGNALNEEIAAIPGVTSVEEL